MKRKIIVFFILMLFLFTTFNVVGINNEYRTINILTPMPDDELDQYQDEYSSWLYYLYENQWLYQPFIPSKQVITRVQLFIFKWNDETNFEITVSIRKEESGVDLTSVTLIPPLEFRGGDWLEFDFPDIATSVGETYYIVCTAYDGTNEDSMCYGWGICLDNSSYTHGDLHRSTDKGRSWSLCISSRTDQPVDGCFMTYGYDDPDAKSDLECEGNLNWSEIQIGTNVTGSFFIENVGFNATMLDWEIKSIPNWGYWAFSQLEGEDLTPEFGKLAIEVTVVAPDDKNTNFNGEILVVNKNDVDDREVIQVSLTTSKNKISYNIPKLLIWMSERFQFILPYFN